MIRHENTLQVKSRLCTNTKKKEKKKKIMYYVQYTHVKSEDAASEMA